MHRFHIPALALPLCLPALDLQNFTTVGCSRGCTMCPQVTMALKKSIGLCRHGGRHERLEHLQLQACAAGLCDTACMQQVTRSSRCCAKVIPALENCFLCPAVPAAARPASEMDCRQLAALCRHAPGQRGAPLLHQGEWLCATRHLRVWVATLAAQAVQASTLPWHGTCPALPCCCSRRPLVPPLPPAPPSPSYWRWRAACCALPA